MDHAVTPQAFWDAYREAFRDKCDWASFKDKRLRTTSARKAATDVIERTFGLRSTNEWFRIDLLGDEPANPVDPKHNWILRVAFDHENDKNWRYEFGSHVHLASDLSVIVSYWNYRNRKNRDLKDDLQESINRVKKQIQRIPNRHWLFVFGPTEKSPEMPFVAYTFDPYAENFVLQQLCDSRRLRLCDLRGFPVHSKK